MVQEKHILIQNKIGYKLSEVYVHSQAGKRQLKLTYNRNHIYITLRYQEQQRETDSIEINTHNFRRDTELIDLT